MENALASIPTLANRHDKRPVNRCLALSNTEQITSGRIYGERLQTVSCHQKRGRLRKHNATKAESNVDASLKTTPTLIDYCPFS